MIRAIIFITSLGIMISLGMLLYSHNSRALNNTHAQPPSLLTISSEMY